MAGRPPKERSFANMLNIAIKEANDLGITKLREVADRIDGKVPQALVGDDESDPINLVTEIRRVIVSKPGD
jgi:hypothetical protein